MSDLDKLIEAVREARAEIARWRAEKQRRDCELDYQDWELARLNLEHWLVMVNVREGALVDAVLARQERLARRRYRLTDAGRAEVAQQAESSQYDDIPF